MRPRRGPEGRRNTAHKAGDSVSALNAEISIAAMIVTANCWNSTPEIPAMNPTGTKTESSTSVIGNDRRRHLRHRLLGGGRRRKIRLFLHHALDVLDDDDRVVDHDSDGEHHRQQRDRVGRIAERDQHYESADKAHWNRNHWDDCGAQTPRNTNTTIATRMKASNRVLRTSRTVSLTKTVLS